MTEGASGMRMAVVGLMAVAMLAGAVPAHGVLEGENGRIVFISGRAPQTDATARAYLLPVPSNTVGGGRLSDPITPAGGQYRHPTWSPDRTKIAFAEGNPAAPGGGLFDIYVQDLETGDIRPITNNTDNLSADRPAWSPDGTRIAYEHQPSAGSADRHIRVQPANDLQPPFNTTDLTAAGAPFEGKPAWSPNSQTVYFHRGDPNTATNANIMRKPATGGTETLAVSDSSISEAQPSISPDGTKICYTLTNGGFNSSADVLVANLTTPPTGGVIVSRSTTLGDYNCTWSPDGQMIAYVNGVFGTGRLVMVRADNSTGPVPIELAEAPGFDGNPDWAPDGRPECADGSVTTAPGEPVTFLVECEDTGPDYERSDVREYADTEPERGKVTQESAGQPFTYTPNEGFTGEDSFRVNSFDGLGFGTDRATITINVRAGGTGGGGGGGSVDVLSCAGKRATKFGTTRKNRIRGTRRADVIVALGGNDTIFGLGGNDIVCAGTGNDRVAGGPGNDRLFGERGNDRVGGSFGNDLLDGSAGNDRLSGGPGGDRMQGDAGRDRLIGGPGRERCNGGSGRDRNTGCERRAGFP